MGDAKIEKNPVLHRLLALCVTPSTMSYTLERLLSTAYNFPKIREKKLAMLGPFKKIYLVVSAGDVVLT